MTLLDLLFPARCAGCRRYGEPWCGQCAASSETVQAASLDGVPLIAGGRFAGSLQFAIHAFKYRGRKRLATSLTRALAQALRDSGIGLQALTFVPLHPARQRERGFNQAEEIARALGAALRVPCVAGLERVRATPAQVGLSQAERRANLSAAFTWRAGGRPPQGLGLVDDVCTTGATLRAAGQAIRVAGGSIDAFLVVARAQTLPPGLVTLPEQSACS